MLTAAHYAEMLEDDTLSPLIRADLEHHYCRALNREKRRAQINEQELKDRHTHVWQLETLRNARWLQGLQFEVNSWRQRKPLPAVYWTAHGELLKALRGFHRRVVRLRREASEGNVMQQRWMEDHADLIAALVGNERSP